MRYNDKQKADVVAFVKKHNQEKGRGGQSAAKEKYGISAITIAKWLTNAGEKLPGKGGPKKGKKAAPKGKPGRPKGKPGRPKGKATKAKTKPAKAKATKGKAGRPKGKAGRPKGSTNASAAKASGGSLSARIQRLAEIDREMQSLQAEFDALKKSL